MRGGASARVLECKADVQTTLRVGVQHLLELVRQGGGDGL